MRRLLLDDKTRSVSINGNGDLLVNRWGLPAILVASGGQSELNKPGECEWIDDNEFVLIGGNARVQSVSTHRLVGNRVEESGETLRAERTHLTTHLFASLSDGHAAVRQDSAWTPFQPTRGHELAYFMRDSEIQSWRMDNDRTAVRSALRDGAWVPAETLNLKKNYGLEPTLTRAGLVLAGRSKGNHCYRLIPFDPRFPLRNLAVEGESDPPGFTDHGWLPAPTASAVSHHSKGASWVNSQGNIVTAPRLVRPSIPSMEF